MVAAGFLVLDGAKAADGHMMWPRVGIPVVLRQGIYTPRGAPDIRGAEYVYEVMRVVRAFHR